jgi:hypothetical protein
MDMNTLTVTVKVGDLPEVQTFLEEVRKRLTEAKALMERYLDSPAEDGEVTPTPLAIDMQAWISGVDDLLRGTSEE